MGIKNTIQGFGKWLFSIKEQKSVSYPLDEELIRRDQIIKAQQQQIQARDTQLGKIKATERQKKEEQKGEEYSQEIAKRLNERDRELKKKRFKHSFSWRKFFNKMGNQSSPTKFAKDILLTDKDFKTTFGFMGDLVTTDNGYNIITDSKGDIIHYARDMSQLVWKPEALSNYIKMKRIPLAVDEDMNPTQDFEEEEHPDVMYFEDEILKNEKGKPIIDKETGKPIRGTYKETLITRRPVKAMLIERDETTKNLQREMEVLEATNIRQTHKIQELTRANKLLENRTNVKEVQVSDVLNRAMHFESKIGDMHTDIIKLTEQRRMYENMLNEYRSAMTNLVNRLKKASQPEYEKAMKDFKDMGDFWAEKLPEKTMIMPAEEKPKMEVAQPGQPLSKVR